MRGKVGSAVRIKICGIVHEEDAQCAAELGAHAIGFVFARSPRRVSPEAARAIVRKLPPLIQTVGVFVDEKAEKVLATAAFCGLDLLQFHGKESAAYCARFGRRVIKAVRVQAQGSVDGCAAYARVADAILLDTHLSGRSGGTGRRFDWNLAVAAKQYGRIILAGGLNADNVASAIRLVDPYGVDVSTGLEKQPGVKDHKKMARFVEAVMNAHDR